jgi:hypothetical protein
LAHADAAQAAGLVRPSASRDQIHRGSHPGEVLQDLPRGRVDVEGHPGVDLLAADDGGRDREVA